MSRNGTVEGLRDVLSAQLPDPTTTQLLRACVHEGPEAEAGWRSWLQRAGDPRKYLTASDRLGRLLPLLQTNLACHEISIGGDLEPYLRTALVHERLRFEIYERAFTDAMGAIARTGVDATLLKGAALARSVFDAPYLRHCHDLDLLVRAPQLTAACEALVERGCRITDANQGSRRAAHPSGLEVMLHTSLLASPVYALDEALLLERRRSLEHPAGTLNILEAEESLVHILAHAATVDRAPAAQWAIDAYRVARTHPRLDWERVRALCCRHGLALALEPMLHYLKHALGCAVPDGLGTELRAEAARRADVECRNVVRGILLVRRGLLRATLSRGSLRSRRAVVRYLMWPPSRDALRLVAGAVRRRAKWGRLPISQFRDSLR